MMGYLAKITEVPRDKRDGMREGAPIARPELGRRLTHPTDPQWQGSPEYREWLSWMKKYYPLGGVADNSNVYGYTVTQTMVAVLQACGNDGAANRSRASCLFGEKENAIMNIPIHYHAAVAAFCSERRWRPECGQYALETG
jgi:hypothetical protein